MGLIGKRKKKRRLKKEKGAQVWATHTHSLELNEAFKTNDERFGKMRTLMRLVQKGRDVTRGARCLALMRVERAHCFS